MSLKEVVDDIFEKIGKFKFKEIKFISEASFFGMCTLDSKIYLGAVSFIDLTRMNYYTDIVLSVLIHEIGHFVVD